MEIVRQPSEGDDAEIKLRGRLDAYWADHLAKELDQLVRDGAHRLWLDMSEVTYLSSVGIGLLLRYQKQLNGLGGSLKVVNPSDIVKEVLNVSRLIPILVSAPPGKPGHVMTTWQMRAPKRGPTRERKGVAFESFEYPADRPLSCLTIGDPKLLTGCRFRAPDCQTVPLGTDSFALGVGALGRDFEDCQSRFGEFLSASGVAAYLPTDGTNVPDYLTAGGTTVPRVRLCYGLVCTGPFSRLDRFEAKPEQGTVTLTELVEASLDATGANVIGMVLVAESAGLMGVALRRSPAQEAPSDAPFAHPEIRDWLSFTGERAYRSSTTLVVGVAARGEAGALAPLLRPLGPGPAPVGHFHAAPFSQRTLPKGEIDLQEIVVSLFESQHLQGVLHLLGDYREAAGLGESEFVRGACWAGPITDVVAERTST
jgi:anti-anti-sigma factor